MSLRQCTSKIVGRDLIGWDECLLHQVLCPLVEDIVVLAQIAGITLPLSVCQCHDKHVPAFFQRLLFIITV